MFRRVFSAFATAVVAAPLLLAAPATAQMKRDDIAPDKMSGMMAHAFFKKFCVDRFGNSQAVRTWADSYMRKQTPNETDDVKTNDIAEVWAEGTSVGGFVLRLTEEPWSCMVSAQNADTAAIHEQLKGMADAIDSEGVYRTELFENTHQESNTRYSMLRMISDDQPNLVIIASTNPNRDIQVNYSISEESSQKN